MHFEVENLNCCLTAGVVLEFQRLKNSSARRFSDTIFPVNSSPTLPIYYLGLILA